MPDTKINTSSRAMLKSILALALPTMLEQLMQTAVQYIDVAMVGSLGTDATSAVGATTTVNWLIGSTVSALSVGFLAMISQAIGAKDEKLIKRASSQTVLAVIAAGILFTIIPLCLSPVVPALMRVEKHIRHDASVYFFILYTPMLFRAASIIFGTALRAAGDTKTPMKIGALVNIINVVLNYLLIFPTRNVIFIKWEFKMIGAGWGVIGAAVASAIAFAVGGILITAAVLGHKVISPIGQSIRPDKDILRPCLKIAIPNMLQRFGTSLGYVAFASMINSLGTVATAAHTLANTVESAFYVPGYGMQTAAATLSGNAVGERDNEKMKRITSMIIKIEIVLMIISGTLLFIFAPNLLKLFSKDAKVIALASVVLRMVAVSEPFYGVSIIIEGVMQGVGETVTPFKFNIIGMWGIRIVGTLIFTQLIGMGLPSAWGCMIAHNVLLFVLFLVHYKRGKWNPLKTT